MISIAWLTTSRIQYQILRASGVLLVFSLLASCSGAECASKAAESIAVRELSNLGQIATFAESNHDSLSGSQMDQLLVIGGSMALSAAMMGVPSEDRMLGLHENGVLWLMQSKDRLKGLIDAKAYELLVNTYEPLAKRVIERREELFREAPPGLPPLL